MHGASHEEAQPLGGVRQQRLLDGAVLPCRHRPHLSGRGCDAGGHDDEPAHGVAGLGSGHPVGDEAAVADPGDVVARHAEEAHGLGGAAGLERHGAERRRGP